MFCYELAVKFINSVLPQANVEMIPLLQKALCYFQLQLTSTSKVNELVLAVINESIDSKSNSMYDKLMTAQKDKQYYKNKYHDSKQRIVDLVAQVNALNADLNNARAQNKQFEADLQKSVEAHEKLLDDEKQMMNNTQDLLNEKASLFKDNEDLFEKIKYLADENTKKSHDIERILAEKADLAKFKEGVMKLL
jgi:uncharacterized phage infection (PIP) family protein YhgE